VRSHVGAPKDARIAGNLQHQAPLVPIVVEPRQGLVHGSEYSRLVTHGTHEVERGVALFQARPSPKPKA
jgi:hypothetical protein